MRQQPPPTPEELFRANLSVIDAVIRHVARRYHLSSEECEEFAGEVRLKLIDNNYEILRRFQYRSNLKTYLTTVIQRLFLDFRNKKWGKWRTSAEAKRLGPLAVELERFVYRDGLTFDEAVGVLTTGAEDAPSRDDLYTLFQALPPRMVRRFVGEQTLEQEPVPGISSEDALLARAEAAAKRRAEEALDAVLQTLSQQDLLLVQLRFLELMSVADIARLLQLEQKGLYRRMSRILSTLRDLLEAQGITPATFLGTGFDEEEDEEDDKGHE